MYFKHSCGLCIAALALVVLPGWLSAAEEALTPREKMLLEKVDALEKRVNDLETKLSESEAAPAAAPTAEETQQLKERVDTIEKGLEEKAAAQENDFRAFWKDGLRFETESGSFKLRVGGRLVTDWAFFDQDDDLKLTVGDENDGGEFRAARLDLRGEIYDNIEFRTEYDFSGDDSDPDFKDVYAGIKGIPYLGNLRIGHFREPFGLEDLTNLSYIMFMERALPDLFAPNRNLGVMASNTLFDDRMTWAIGAFETTDNFPSDNDADEDQGYAITARLTGLPWYADEGKRYLHLGLAYSHRNPDGATISYATRPEAHLANQYLNVNSNLINGFRLTDARADNIDLWGTEAMFVYGPFSLQGEYMLSQVDTTFGGDVDFDGWYLEGSYFLTGEYRGYETKGAVPARVKPKSNFSLGENRGWGAWELALRYSTVDLNDGIVRGGEESNWTLGLNWYLNPNTKFMLNYVLADIEHDLYEGDLNTLEARFQVDFF